MSSTDNEAYWSEVIVLTMELIFYSYEVRFINCLPLSKEVHFLRVN